MSNSNLETTTKPPPIEKKQGFLQNLFGSPINIVITLFLCYILVRVLMWLVGWGIINATWVGDNKQICFDNGGACWIFIGEKLKFFIYGFIPQSTYWRINVLFLLILGSCSLFFINRVKYKPFIFMSYLVIFPLWIKIFVIGGLFGLEVISFNLWGGFMLTFIFSLLGLLYSFPIGLLLALGRRSPLPVIKYVSIGYIEFFRGIPLITILFVSSTVLPFFLPPGMEIPKVIRVTLGLIFFQSAYLSEVVRGGLQTIEKSQYESADSLGLHYIHKMYYVILPQALRNVIINIGDISIAFVKDTTLVYIIGLFDMLGVYVPTTSDPYWLGTEPEALIFSGFLYWLLCSVVAWFVRIIDRKVNKDRKGVTI